MSARGRWIALAAVAALVLLGAGLWLSGGGGTARVAVEQPAEGDGGAISWNYSVWGPRRAFTAGIERGKALLEAASDGRFELKIHYASALTPAREALDSLKVGLLEAAHVCFAYHPMKVPLTQVLALPFLLTDDIEVNAWVTDALFRHPAVAADLERRWNAVYLFPAVLAPYELMGNVRIASTDDMQGARLRVPGEYAEVFQALDAVQVMVTAPEAYTAVERGTIDLVAFPWTDSFGAYRMHEVSGYATEGLKLPGSGCMTAARKDAWEALPAAMRERLPEIRKAAIEAYFDAYAAADRKWLPEFRKSLELVEFPQAERDKLVELSRPIWRRWAEAMDARGLQGTEVLQFVQDEIVRQRERLAAQ